MCYVAFLKTLIKEGSCVKSTGNYFLMTHAKSFFFVYVVIALLMLNSGCASVPLGQTHLTASKSKDLADKSIIFISFKTKNEYRPDYPAYVFGITILDNNTKVEQVFPVFDWDEMKMGQQKSADEGWKETGVGIILSPGSYRLWSVGGSSWENIYSGNFVFPFDIPFWVEKGEFVYLGRIEMTNRERTSDNEVPSGGRLPLAPQSLSGFGGGTFNIRILDEFEKDMVHIKKIFPVVATGEKEVKKRILPQWTKPSDGPNPLNRGGGGFRW